MIIVNLDKYSSDGFKQSANSLTATSPDNITHARLYYDSFTGSDYIQGAFVVGKNSTLEFDNSGVSFTKYKLFESTDGVTYTENKTYGGTEGRDEFNSSLALDPADYEDYDIPVKTTISTVEQFVPMTISEVVDGAGLSMNDYYYLRGKLFQDNTVYSGRPFFGAMLVNGDTGALIGGGISYYANSTNNLVNTVSDFIYRTGSGKVSTGVYYLQCTMGATGATSTNGMRVEVAGSSFRYKFENSVFPVYGSRTVAFTGDVYEETYVPGLVGYVVLDVNDEAQTYYDTGKLLIKTYNTSWVLL